MLRIYQNKIMASIYLRGKEKENYFYLSMRVDSEMREKKATDQRKHGLLGR